MSEADCVVVVSALGGVTQSLVELSGIAEAGDPAYRGLLSDLVARHAEAAERLATAEDATELKTALDGWAAELSDLLDGVSLTRECTPKARDSILSYGELSSSALVAAAFRRSGVAAVARDARSLIVTDRTFGQARVDLDASRESVRGQIDRADGLSVVTGFIGGTPGGETTTLGRGGSDYTAALLAALLDAERIELWTDVDGVMSADPRLVPGASSLRTLSYEELLELAHFGAKVVYPPSVHPAREQGIPLVIRNTLNPTFEGTFVEPGFVSAADAGPVRGIASIEDVALVRIEGDGMVGVPGIAQRLFGSLARAGISVILISQASSEHSICFAIAPDGLEAACAAVEEEFALEQSAGLIDPLVVEADSAVVAAVGSGMRDTPGVAGRLFSILGARGINVRAIAQGSSELNISVVVERADMEDGVRALHEAFFDPGVLRAHVYLAGLGNVGAELLRQIDAVGQALEAEQGIRLTIAGVANSRNCALGLEDASAEAWRRALEEGDHPADALVQAALDDRAAFRVFVDCTAADQLPRSYASLLAAGVPVVAANKKGFAGGTADYHAHRTGAKARAYLEATVGAGLPVIRSLEAFRATGDEVEEVTAVLSGTVAYLMGEVMSGTPFSEAVRTARSLGFTEPDPRDDLSGHDVARKLLILSREIGWEVEPEQVMVDPILPGDGWDGLSVEEFLDRLTDVDADFAERRADAVEQGAKLCYVATARDGAAGVSLQAVPVGHVCHALTGTDNLVAVRSARYPSPLVIRGAGAGREVTASGVLADVVRAVTERQVAGPQVGRPQLSQGGVPEHENAERQVTDGTSRTLQS